MNFDPIGIVSSPITEPLDDIWGGVVARITLDESRFSAESLAGLDQYSHVEIVFHFHKIDPAKVDYKLRRPRGREDWPLVGIFAQRAKMRPNRIGVTVCKLLRVDGLSIEVESLDAIDGTPVLDIKPYLKEFGPKGEVRQPAWSHELMAGYFRKASGETSES